jgi:hypothetical protein
MGIGDREPTPSGLSRSRRALALSSLLVAVACDPLGAQPESQPATTVKDPPPHCIEIDPPADLAAAVNDELATNMTYWATQRVQLSGEPPLYVEAMDDTCALPGGLVEGGPTYAGFLNRMVIQPFPGKINLNVPLELELVIAHEEGHEVQNLTQGVMLPRTASDEQRRTYRILRELQAYCFAGEKLAATNPANVEPAADFASTLVLIDDVDGNLYRQEVLVGAESGTCDYEAIAARADIPYPIASAKQG